MTAQMTLNTQVNNKAQARETVGYVTAKDGTKLGYKQVGTGPGVVLLHGSMEWSDSHRELAQALADRYTVYLLDRRGRGLSGPHSEHYTAQEDVDDLEALLNHTGARYVFGLSSGAIMLLQSLLSLPMIQKAAIYEPPLLADPEEGRALVTRFDAEIDQGKLTAAMVTAMLGAQMGPSFFQYIPRWILEGLTGFGMAQEEKGLKPGELSMRMLAPTVHYDFELVAEASGNLERFKAVQAKTLLLGGDQSPKYLTEALDRLEKILPGAMRVEFNGAGHGASGNKDRMGQPERVAETLREFFG